MIFGVWSLIFTLNLDMSRSKENKFSQDFWIVIDVFCTISLGVGISILYFLKRIIVDDNSIKIKFFFRNKRFEYKNDEILGFAQHFSYGRYKNVESFHFKTFDNKTYMFSDSEFSNYVEISSFIAQKTKQLEISKFHNLPIFLLILLVSGFVCTTIIYTTLYLF